MRVLVLGRSSFYRRMLTGALASIGHTDVIEAEAEKTAQRMLRTEPGDRPGADLVIVVWETAERDHVPLLQWLREDAVCGQLPAIVVSDRASQEDVLFASRSGADTYMLTPFTPETLREKLTYVVAARKNVGVAAATAVVNKNGGASSLDQLTEVLMKGAPATALQQKPRVLIVEDNESSRALIQLCLRDEYEVVAAANLAAALHESVRSRFSAVLIDINLDGESGLDLLEVLQAMPAYRSVPKIACTAFLMSSDRERLLEWGFDAYINKPFRKQHLLDTLNRVLHDRAVAA